MSRALTALVEGPTAPITTRAATTPYAEVGFSITRGDTPTQFQGVGKNVRVQGFERNAVVSACVRQIVPMLAAVPYEVYRKATGDGDVTILPNSPLQTVLETPFYTLDPYQMRAIWCVSMLIYGNAFSVILRQNNQPGAPAIGLRPVHPERVVYVYLDAQTMEPYAYDWRDRNGVMYRTAVEDMLHWKDTNAIDWLFGYPRGAAALGEIAGDNEATEYSRQLLVNDGTAGTIIEIEDRMSTQQLKDEEDRYRSKMIDRGRRGTTQFMTGLKAVHKIGSPLREMEFPDLRKLTREDICAAFGVDARICGFGTAKEGGLSGKQFFEARFRMVQQTIIPLTHQWESHVNHWLTSEFGNVYARFSRTGLADMTEDEQETWDRSDKALAAGKITREEARVMCGLPATPDADDTIVVINTTLMVPVARQFEAIDQADQLAGAQVDAIKNPKPPLVAVGPDGQPVEPKAGPPNGKEPDGPGKKVAAGKPADRTVSVTSNTNGLVFRKAVLTSDDRAAIWSHKDSTARAQEASYETAALLRFRTEATRIGGIIRTATTKRATVPDPYLADVQAQIERLYRQPKGELYQRWAEDYATLIGETTATVGQQMAEALGYAEFSLDNPVIHQVIAQRAGRLASLVSGTTAAQIAAALHSARELGLSMSAAADLIESTVFSEQLTGQRAKTIARTESIGAMNAGELATAKASGVVVSKEWLTQGDDRVRDTHAAQAGEVRSLDEAFSNGCQHPGDPEADPEETINCRCSMLYHTDAEAPTDD